MNARRIVAAVLLILASLLAPFAVGANWAQRTLTDTQQFAATVGPLAEDPIVQQAVERLVADAVIDAVDVESRLDQIGFLPDAITESVAAGVNSAIESRVEDYVQGERFGDLWVALSTEVQAQVTRMLEDSGTGAIQLQDGQIVLDLAVTADLVKAELAERGVPFVGEIDAGLVTGQVVLTDAPNLQIVVDALRIFLPVAAWLWVVVLVMLVVAVMLWRPRARGMLWAGLGLFVGGLLTWLALGLGSAQVAESAPNPNARALISALIDQLVVFLDNALLVMIALGLVLMVGGWLAGGTQSGRQIRDRIAAAAHGWGSPWAGSGLGRFTSEHPMFVPTMRAVVLVGALLFLLTADRLYPSTIIWTFAIVAGLLLAIEVVEGSGLTREEAHAGALVVEAADAPWSSST